MSYLVRSPDPDNPVEIDLRNRYLAALWAWLIPGAGHVYQRRYAKAILYAVCILGTFFFGLGLGRNKVVYASFRRPDMRYPYICQVFVGLPALPALVQRQRVMGGADQRRPGAAAPEPLWNGWMAPPHQPVVEQEPDELAYWHRQLKGKFELGTLYTMVAGLLNVLAIYDAYAGPVFISPEEKRKQMAKSESQSDKATDS